MANESTFRTSYNEGISKFRSVRNKAFWQEMLHHFTGKNSDLLNFDEIRSRLHLHEEHYQGVHDVPLNQIAGSVGRYKDFTASFLPKKAEMQERWSRVYALANSQEGPPPIELYKVGDVYFVRDGNHRVSVAHQLGSKTIQAHVIELPTTVPLRPGMSDQQIEAAEAYANFLEETGLSRAVTDHESIELTVAARYHELMGYIFLHERVQEKVEGHPLTTEEVTADWYHNVYEPAMQLIRKHHVLELAKGKHTARTEGDLFLWLMNNLLELRHQYGDRAPVQSFSGALKTYLEEEHVHVPEALESEEDQSVLLTRKQVRNARPAQAGKQADPEDSDLSETCSQIT